MFSRDLAIDLGTANTLIYVRDEGIVLKRALGCGNSNHRVPKKRSSSWPGC